MNNRNLSTRLKDFNFKLFLFLFISVIAYNLYIFKQMVHSLCFAAIISGAFFPLHKKIKKRLRLSEEMSAALTTSLVTILILLPLIFILFQISKEGVNLYSNIQKGFSIEQVKNLFSGEGFFAQTITETSKILHLNITSQQVYMALMSKVQSYSGIILSQINNIIGNIFNFFFQFLIMLVALFALFLDGHKMKAFFLKLNPLPDEQEEMILQKFSQMNYVTLICNGLGGILQGGLAGVALWIAGFNSIFLWSSIMTILAFIPLVGISFVTIPTTIYLFVTGEKITAIIFFIFTSTLSLITENFLKPRFMGKGTKVHSLVLLFYIIAGMQTFGMAGIFYGPLFCTIFLTMADLFQKNYMAIDLEGHSKGKL